MSDEDALAAAELALHNLLTGAAAVEVDIAGSGGANYRTKFKAADSDKLGAYIATLKDRIAGRCRQRGAIGIVF